MLRRADAAERERGEASSRGAARDSLEQHLGRHDHHVGRHTIPRHAVFALLHSLVQAHLLLLGDGVHHHLVVHRGADVALRAKIFVAWERRRSMLSNRHDGRMQTGSDSRS